ncbi:MAG TPA: hypothetical protein VF706_03430, partial [Solirubrobacteraceae bacterium]
WQQGERRLRAEAPERRRAMERVTDALVAELRRRLGGRFSSDELVALYDRGTSWCLQIAMTVAPDEPWAWDAAVVADAAFSRYLREAADYAGGRREIAQTG